MLASRSSNHAVVPSGMHNDKAGVGTLTDVPSPKYEKKQKRNGFGVNPYSPANQLPPNSIKTTSAHSSQLANSIAESGSNQSDLSQQSSFANSHGKKSKDVHFLRQATAQKTKDQQKTSSIMQENVIISGYVKRMAARNATACVNAIFEFSHPRKRKVSNIIHHDVPISIKNTDQWVDNPSHSKESGCLGKRKDLKDAGPLNKRKKLTPSDVTAESSSTFSKIRNSNIVSGKLSVPSPAVSSSSASDESDVESVESFISASSKQSCHLDEYCDDVPYNFFGILYNGDCVYTNARFFNFAPSLTEKILPTVVPLHLENVSPMKTKSLSLSDETVKRPHKGDNGWTPVGSAIKTISINMGKGQQIVQRKYYIGIKRKQEVLYSRDSVLLKSGSRKQDAPFVAKIASIWQESDGLMMTVFWYYRREDTDEVSSSHFIGMEVMASQHHDDIGVACIDDKCFVLGLAEFARFRATVERMPLVKAARQSQSKTKLKQQLSNLGDIDSECERLLKSEVFLCFRAYNQVTGKVIKAVGSYN